MIDERFTVLIERLVMMDATDKPTLHDTLRLVSKFYVSSMLKRSRAVVGSDDAFHWDNICRALKIAIIKQEAEREAADRLKVGARVKSKAIGSRRAFAGIIMAAFEVTLSSGHKKWFHVQASDGTLWHRDPQDLTIVPRKKLTPRGKHCG